jgi:hypothetical protein
MVARRRHITGSREKWEPAHKTVNLEMCDTLIFMDRQERIIRAAGILEGEGTFSLSHTGSAKASCEMTDYDVVAELADLFGGSVSEVARRNPKWKQSWRWLASGRTAYEAMEAILPYMFSRRKEKLISIMEPWAKMDADRSARSSYLDEIAQRYLDGEGSLRELASKYGTTAQSVLNHARALETKV